jgi:hypothetical protein
MKSQPAGWNQAPAILDVARQLHDLSLRAARLDLHQKLRRAKAMLAALEQTRRRT